MKKIKKKIRKNKFNLDDDNFNDKTHKFNSCFAETFYDTVRIFIDKKK